MRKSRAELMRARAVDVSEAAVHALLVDPKAPGRRFELYLQIAGGPSCSSGGSSAAEQEVRASLIDHAASAMYAVWLMSGA